MKTSIKQARAINYYYLKKRREERERQAKARGLDIVYKYQTVYKTLQGLLNADTERLAKAIESATENAEKRVNQLVRCGCKSETLTNTIKELETLQKNEQSKTARKMFHVKQCETRSINTMTISNIIELIKNDNMLNRGK